MTVIASPPALVRIEPSSFLRNSSHFDEPVTARSQPSGRPGWGRVVVSQAFIDIDADAEASDRDFDLSAPTTITSLLLSKDLPQRWKASLGYYRHSEMYWLNQGDRVPVVNRFDLRLARSFGAPSADNEVAIVAQSVNGRYPEFYARKFRHEPQLFATLRLAW